MNKVYSCKEFDEYNEDLDYLSDEGIGLCLFLLERSNKEVVLLLEQIKEVSVSQRIIINKIRGIL